MDRKIFFCSLAVKCQLLGRCAKRNFCLGVQKNCRIRTFANYSNGYTQSQAGVRGADVRRPLTLIKVRGTDLHATIP